MLKRKIIYLLTILLLSLAGFLSITSLRLKSFTIDEYNWYLVGRELVSDFNWDTQIKRNHPPLTFFIHGLPSLIITSQDAYIQLFWARLAMQPFLILFGLSLFIYTRKILDGKTALISLFLFCLSIEILAHGRLLTKDLTQAFFVFLTLAEFYLYLKTKNKLNFFKTSIFGGLALLTKYSAFLLLPLLFLLWVFYCAISKKIFFPKITYLLFGFLTIILLIQASYLFKGIGQIPQSFETKPFQFILCQPTLKPALYLIPKPYLQGFDHVFADSQTNWGHSFFWGENRNGLPGLWYFFPVTFLVKTPIPLLILFFSGCLTIFWQKNKKTKFFLSYCLLIIVFFGFYLSAFLNLTIGFRYALMIYPFVFIIAATLAKQILFDQKKIFKKIIIIFLLLWYARETLFIYPHFLAYTNQLIGGPKKAYLYFADSNLDWSQDWLLIHQYLGEHPGIAFDPKIPTSGKIAVNVNSYNLYNYQEYLWLRKLNKQPIDWVGYTWLIFQINPEEINETK